jgi:hypothetical protein
MEHRFRQARGDADDTQRYRGLSQPQASDVFALVASSHRTASHGAKRRVRYVCYFWLSHVQLCSDIHFTGLSLTHVHAHSPKANKLTNKQP